MKKVIGVFVMVLSSSLLTACSNGPADVAEQFMEHLIDGNYQEASELATAETQLALQMAETRGKSLIKNEVDLEITDEKIGSNSAKITFLDKISGKDSDIEVVKINGEWRVRMGRW